MFTGIIESLGTVTEIMANGSNLTFTLRSPLSHGFKPDQSVSHDGVCLTVEKVSADSHTVTAIAETLDKTTLGSWKTGQTINLEQCLSMNSRLDGHFVQGHVDTTATCKKIRSRDGSREITFSFDPAFAPLVIEKGSVCINGISLTAFDISKKTFRVAIIPYTWEHTNMKFLEEGQKANIEFDILGKYILRSLSLKK